MSRTLLLFRHVAEDSTQLALARMWRKLPRLRDPDRSEAWSSRLLVNACYRKSKRRRRWSEPPPVVGPDSTDS